MVGLDVAIKEIIVSTRAVGVNNQRNNSLYKN